MLEGLVGVSLNIGIGAEKATSVRLQRETSRFGNIKRLCTLGVTCWVWETGWTNQACGWSIHQPPCWRWGSFSPGGVGPPGKAGYRLGAASCTGKGAAGGWRSERGDKTTKLTDWFLSALKVLSSCLMGVFVFHFVNHLTAEIICVFCVLSLNGKIC